MHAPHLLGLRVRPHRGGACAAPRARAAPPRVENLHLLCWQHHLDKTNGLLDPTRLPAQAGKPGRTRWTVGRHGDAVTVLDDLDHASLEMVELLTAAWTGFLRGTRAGNPATSPNSPPEHPADRRVLTTPVAGEPTLQTQAPPGPPPTATPSHGETPTPPAQLPEPPPGGMGRPRSAAPS